MLARPANPQSMHQQNACDIRRVDPVLTGQFLRSACHCRCRAGAANVADVPLSTEPTSRRFRRTSKPVVQSNFLPRGMSEHVHDAHPDANRRRLSHA
jgi:hypothetical protein